MDITLIRTKGVAWLKKYKYVVIILLVGVVLMLCPTETKNKEVSIPIEPDKRTIHLEITAEQLEEMLSHIQGVGKVEVLLTYAAGERAVFHTNEHRASTEGSLSEEYETVLITDNNREEEALVAQILPPEYQGAVIVCQGAENPSVKFAVSEAVSKATGLGTDRISVLKMK